MKKVHQRRRILFTKYLQELDENLELSAAQENSKEP